jgi:hypothetical protein
MDKHNPRPNGETGGGDLPDRGKMTGVTDTYGGNLEQGYQNEGKMNSCTKSDPAEQGFGKSQRVGDK